MTAPPALTRVEGPNLVLRLIRPDDADYVFGLRTDPAFNRHLSEVRGTVVDQRRWIEFYKAREADLRELYYVIERKDGIRCGLVRLYEFGQETFTWGSWILDKSKPPKAALESAVLSFHVGFEMLGYEKALVEARAENENAIAFYRRLGMTETGRADEDVYFMYLRHRFEADRIAFMKSLEHRDTKTEMHI